MATIPIQPMEAVRSTTGGPPYVLSFLEAASQTFRVGAVLILRSGGYVMEATIANPGGIVGVALEAGSALAVDGGSDGKQKVAVALALPSNVFVANADGVTANSDVGLTFGVEKSGNFWVIDKSGGVANRKANIQELDSRDTVGDTNGRLLFTFHPTATSFAYVS